MSERLAPQEISRRSTRLQIALAETYWETMKRQRALSARTLQEIRTTGDSLEYGEILSSLDTLLAIPLRKQRAEHRHKIVAVAETLRDTFGEDSIGEVYRVWKSHQTPQSKK